MTRRRRWLLAILAVVLIGVATPTALMLLPCKSHAVVLLNAAHGAAQVTLQIENSQTRFTVWSGTVETHVPPLRIPVGGLRLEGHYSMAVRFPETGRSIPEFKFGYITPYLFGVEFLLIRDEDIIHAFWHDPPLTNQPAGLWETASELIALLSCLNG